jgi:ABC-2 type transport system ATP-binding protein
MIVNASGISKRFSAKKMPDIVALDDVSFSLAAGEILGLVGPDGAGKTTLLRALAGLTPLTSGTAYIFGSDIAQLDRARLGYLPQSGGTYADISVLDNLRLYARLKHLPREMEDAAIERILQASDLAPFAKRLAGRLSGGMRMKLAVGCAMIARPDLLLLDEPSVGVDPVSRADMWNFVRALAHDMPNAKNTAGAAIIWATSYLDEAEKADRILLLHEGRTQFLGPPQDFAQQTQGRVYSMVVGGMQGRRVLSAALQTPEIIDGTVQGNMVRVLVKQGSPPPEQGPLRHLNIPASIAMKSRLEDSFVAALGGARTGPSALAAAYPRYDQQADDRTIEANGLTKVYGRFKAADAISFDVKRGEIFGLLGPNGAGKSTTFKMLCGLISASSGSGRVNGFDLRSAKAEARQSLGYMAQKFSLYSDLSVRQNLRFFAGAYGLYGAQARAATEQVSDVFDLGRYADSDAGALPMGYKQRLSLACAVMHQPPVLFLDEPTSGVDPLVRREFWSHINGLAERGVTIFITTHFMDEAEYCDRIAVIFRGSVIALGSPQALKSGAVTAVRPDPTLEQAFVALVSQNHGAATA